MTTLTLVKKTSLTVSSFAATVFLSLCTPAEAFMFGTSGIQFDEDTPINFTFDRSQGLYQSSLWVAKSAGKDLGYSNISSLFNETKPSDNGSAKNGEGTFGNAVTSKDGKITQTFTFLKDQVYALLLWSDTGTGKPFEQFVSSSSFMNSSLWFAADSKFSRIDCLATGCQQTVFGDFKLNYESTNPFSTDNDGKSPEQFKSATTEQLAQGTKVSFDDGQKASEADFKQFTVSAQAVPEPMSLLGTILGIGALATARSKKKQYQQTKK
ncbi:PEP-CTERM sorting domain-containing protein [Tychonema sp. BBK16]|uniref:PEP-CTERM sorting domain-containing protein n=1 Tax=Tychonema sp. BBK16 TaxID=2699888 RepID=UPI001F287B37|nr:PEP-CTERM sorting domain-containing protein [Tychonema sp. BBK16]MCF6373984.1 PEP-CTERM sorting domain-containing protein [Tychonema sp. BBK16]